MCLYCYMINDSKAGLSFIVQGKNPKPSDFCQIPSERAVVFFLQAEEFHSVVHVLLEWLAEAEQALRFHGILPDDEEALRTLIDQHRVSKIMERMLTAGLDLLKGNKMKPSKVSLA